MSKNMKIFTFLVIISFMMGIVSIEFLAKDNSSKVTKGEKENKIISRETEEIKLTNSENITTFDYLNDTTSRSGSREKEISENIEIEMVDEIHEESDVQENYEEQTIEVYYEPEVYEEEPANEVEYEEYENGLPEIYCGYEVAGKIEIPKTGTSLYIFKNLTASGMEIASCIIYSKGDLNKNGACLIGGHNYMNGTLFSNNEYIDIGDNIYITSLDGISRVYTVYNKFYTSPEDTSYINRNSACAPEIYLQSCAEDGTDNVLIIQAR